MNTTKQTLTLNIPEGYELTGEYCQPGYGKPFLFSGEVKVSDGEYTGDYPILRRKRVRVVKYREAFITTKTSLGDDKYWYQDAHGVFRCTYGYPSAIDSMLYTREETEE